MTRIAILDDYQNVAMEMADWSRLPETCDVISFDDHLHEEDPLVDRLEEFEVICAMRERTPFPRSLLERLPNLKLLITSGARNASIDVAAAAERGVVVCGTGSVGHATAELTWGLILALYRHIPTEHQSVMEGGWMNTVGNDLGGKTLGLIGLGRLGGRVCAVARAFDMRVVAWSRNLTAERAAEQGAERVELDELLSTSDIVSIHLVLSDRTRGLIGAEQLARMKPSAILVNTSRGPIVDEVALVQAVNHGQIRGVGLDVYDVEPLSYDHPMRQLPNSILTPHIGYVTEESYRRFYGDMVENILAYLAGDPVRVIRPAGG
jgi:phosphoglycerate dehydrogenase-like enzyme